MMFIVGLLGLTSACTLSDNTEVDVSWSGYDTPCKLCTCLPYGLLKCVDAPCQTSTTTTTTTTGPMYCVLATKEVVPNGWHGDGNCPCVCIDGHLSCPVCPPPTPTCTLPDGTILQPGQSGKVDCNTCFCGNNGVLACTKLACPPNTCTLPDGTILQPGHSGKVDCNTCFCGGSGILSCSQMLCPKKFCTLAGGHHVPIGWKGKQGCKNCQCMTGGQLKCNSKQCPQPHPTCKLSDGTKVNGGWTGVDGCSFCLCKGQDALACLPLPFCQPSTTTTTSPTTTTTTAPAGCYVPMSGLVSVGWTGEIQCQQCTCIASNDLSCIGIPCDY